MKNINKIIALILALAMLSSVLSGCAIIFPSENGGEGSGNESEGGNGSSEENGGNSSGNEGENGNTGDGGNNDNTQGGGNTESGDQGGEDTVYFTGRQSVLLLGQSNMAGRGFAEDVAPISDDRILMMNSSKAWVKMQEPIHFDKADAGVGLAASFAKAFVDTFDCEIGLVPAAVGGTSIGDWAVGGTLYNNALEMAKEAQKTSEICAILWHQGESNRSNHSTYAQKLQTILDSLIDELGLDADKIVIITGELREISTNVDKRDSFHAQLGQLSSVYKNYGVADAEGLTLNKDIIHFDAPSQRVFGYRYFNIFKTLVTGTGYDFVDDRNYYYVGAENDHNPTNSGYTDLPNDNPGGSIGGNTSDGEKIKIEGVVVEDTFIWSGSKYADENYVDRDYINTNKNSYRPIIKFNFSNFFGAGGFEANKNNAKVEFTFAIVDGASNITTGTLANAYGFLPGEGVTDVDMSTLTWNSCKEGAANAAFYRGTSGATFIYKDKAIDESWIVKTDTHITFILNYSDVEKFICMEEGDNYGIAFISFDFSSVNIKLASTESKSYDVPKVDFVYDSNYKPEAPDSVFDVVAENPDSELCFVGKSNKDALTYAVGEEMSFEISLTADGKVVSAPYFYYTIEGEDAQTMTEAYVDGSLGSFTVKGTMSKPGTLRITVYVCNENKEIQTKNNSALYVKNGNGIKENLIFRGGAIAGFDDIEAAGNAPADLEEYWNGVVADCYEGDIKLLRFEELNVADYNSSKVSTHKLYLVEIECAGGFATGYLSVPTTVDSARIKATFVSYGNAKKPKPEFSNDAVLFAICAHSFHLDDENAAAPENYGFDLTENQNRDTVYFKNMFIRNITATRFLKAYAGDGSYGRIIFNDETVSPLNIWDKSKGFTVEGGSQAAFQALAITALDKDVTRAILGLTWFCDIGGESLGRFEGWNPEYTDALMYYDCCSLATMIADGVEISISAAGLGDTTSEISGIIALYNALDCTVTLTVYQNRSHTYNPPIADTYKKSK